MSDAPMAGDWYVQLSRPKKVVFNVLCRIVGDMVALSLCGFYRYIRAYTHEQKEDV